MIIGGESDDRHSTSSQATSSGRNQMLDNSRSDRPALSARSSSYNHHKPPRISEPSSSDKFRESTYSGHHDAAAGISFITPTIPAQSRQTAPSAHSSITHHPFDYRSASAISNSTSSSSGGSFISGGQKELSLPSTEKHLRFHNTTQNFPKNDLVMVMSLANMESLDSQKVFNFIIIPII